MFGYSHLLLFTPIFKKGKACDPNNYRPISLAGTMRKLMESAIKDQLTRYLVRKDIINKHQHAFMENHSTANNLLDCINDWVVRLRSGQTFDSLVTSKLLLKLEFYGISGLLLNWVKCFFV